MFFFFRGRESKSDGVKLQIALAPTLDAMNGELSLYVGGGGSVLNGALKNGFKWNSFLPCLVEIRRSLHIIPGKSKLRCEVVTFLHLSNRAAKQQKHYRGKQHLPLTRRIHQGIKMC